MNIHEKIDSFSNVSPRVKAGICLGMIALILFACFIFSCGKSRGIATSSAQRTAKETALEKEIAVSAIREKGIRDEAQKILAQNEILRAHNEAQNEILAKTAKKTDFEKVEKLNQISEELTKKYEEISNSVDDDGLQRLALCDEALRAGYRLSAEFCRAN